MGRNLGKIILRVGFRVQRTKEKMKVTYHRPLSEKQFIMADPTSESGGKSRAGVKLGTSFERGSSAENTSKGFRVLVLAIPAMEVTRELLMEG